ILKKTRGGSFYVPVYGNGRFLSHIPYNIVSVKKEIPQIFYAKVLNPKSEELNKQVVEKNYKAEEINIENLVLMKDSLSLIFSPEVISRIQSYPYYGGEPDSDFKMMCKSTQSSWIVKRFSEEVASFKDNETFISHRNLSYRTGELWFAVRGILQVKLKDGSITEQDMEYIFKDGKSNEQKAGGFELELVTAKPLGEKRIKK
ncbi:MAG TPA: hypothetical protein VEF53_02930, partial [Patescibacteria group bacterium]|nr:hypothetical protein [Patescibacteria group bacterium]